jgi:hypothetical protein
MSTVIAFEPALLEVTNGILSSESEGAARLR